MLEIIAARRLRIAVAGLTLVAGLVAQTAPPQLASGHASPPSRFASALPARSSSPLTGQVALSDPGAARFRLVHAASAAGHENRHTRHIWLHRSNRLIPVPRSAGHLQPYLTTKAAVAAERRVKLGRAPVTTVPQVNGGVVRRWLARGARARLGDVSLGTSFNGAAYTGYLPPNGSFAAGPHEVITAVNEQVNTFTKSGAVLTSQSLNSLFSGLPDGFPFDPHVVFDPTSQRFWLTATANASADSSSYFYIAVSNDNDTQHGWSIFWLPANAHLPGDWCGFPEIGLSGGGFVYLTCNFYGFGGPGDAPEKYGASGTNFKSALIRVIPESDFTGGPCCAWYEWWDLGAFAIQPTVARDASPGDPAWLASSANAGGSSVTVWKVTNEGSSSPTLSSASFTTGAYNPPPCATQPGLQCLDNGDARLLGAYWQSPYLYMWSDVACGAYSCPFLAMVNTGTGTMTQDFSITHGAVFSMYPHFGVRPDGSMTYTSDVVNNSTYAGSWAQAIPDPSVCMDCVDGNPVWTATGGGNYQQLDGQSRNRWGAYSGAWPDPDGTGIWVMSEYATNSNTWAIEDTLTREPGDTTPPASSANLSPAPNAGGWNNSDVTVNVGATDAGTGVYFQTLQGTGAQSFGPTDYAGSVAAPTISTEGTTTVTYTATDNWHNTNAPQQIGVRLDTTPPVTTGITFSPASPSNAGTVKINGMASDPGCGTTGSCVQTLEYWVNTAVDGTNSGSWVFRGSSNGASGSFNWTTGSFADGRHLIAVDPVDYANNFSSCNPPAPQCATFQVDHTPPVTSLQLNGKAPAANAYTYPIVASLSAADPAIGSGIAHTYYGIDGAALNPYTGAFKIYSAGAGKHTVRYYSTDKAGNVESAHSVVVKMVPPKVTYKLTTTNTKVAGVVAGTISMDYANLSCGLGSCSYTGIVPNVSIHFTEKPKTPNRHFQYWIVNGAKKMGTSILVKITKSSMVQAVYK